MFLRYRTSVANDRRGFTLLEIVLALAITSLVVSVVYTTMRTAGRTLQGLSARNELYRSTYALLEEIGTELASAFLSRHVSPLTGHARTYFYVEDRRRDNRPQDTLAFTTLGRALSPMARGESDQGEVCYTVRQSRTRDELVLLRMEDATLDETSCREVMETGLEGPYGELPIPVATGIHPERGGGYRLVGFQVDCFRTTDPDEEPEPDWDSERLRTLPSRVRVTLTYEDERERLYPFSKTVLLRLK